MSVSVALSAMSNLVGRVIAPMIPSRLSAEAGFDPYEPAPMSREEVSKLFNLDGVTPWSVDNKMRESERRELDSMALIRGALYSNN